MGPDPVQSPCVMPPGPKYGRGLNPPSLFIMPFIPIGTTKGAGLKMLDLNYQCLLLNN
jgi:hypothetical protein